MFPLRFHKPPYKYEASLIPLSGQPGVRQTITPPCLNKGNLLLLSFLFCLARTVPYIILMDDINYRRNWMWGIWELCIIFTVFL